MCALLKLLKPPTLASRPGFGRWMNVGYGCIDEDAIRPGALNSELPLPKSCFRGIAPGCIGPGPCCKYGFLGASGVGPFIGPIYAGSLSAGRRCSRPRSSGTSGRPPGTPGAARLKPTGCITLDGFIYSLPFADLSPM